MKRNKCLICDIGYVSSESVEVLSLYLSSYMCFQHNTLEFLGTVLTTLVRTPSISSLMALMKMHSFMKFEFLRLTLDYYPNSCSLFGHNLVSRPQLGRV
jgi:hypothetical protein